MSDRVSSQLCGIFVCPTFLFSAHTFPKKTPTKQIMFTKRPDKHTTGLINMRNDCFANASIQAFSALPGLTKYLNLFLKIYGNFFRIGTKYHISFANIISRDEVHHILQLSSSRKRHDIGDDNAPLKDLFIVTLHLALAEMVKKLQETQMATRTISVWTFLHELERIYNAKISRSQHDAHELTQLIVETLETENEVCANILKKLIDAIVKEGASELDIEAIDVPDFPFTGLLLSQMKCLTCLHVSKPSFSPFQMLTLHPPQAPTSDLESLLNENETETISGYQCLKCRIEAIVLYQNDAGHGQGIQADREMSMLQQLSSDENLFINEDLPTSLESFMETFTSQVKPVTSKVFRTTQIIKPPRVFAVHLSRSTFDGVSVSRNPCRVSFKEKLNISLKQDQVNEIQKHREFFDLKLDKSMLKILTTDVNDMEDESLQREDIEEEGYDSETTEGTSGTDADTLSLESLGSSSMSMDGSDSPSLGTETAMQGVTDASREGTNGEALCSRQKLKLQRHFQKFHFEESNIYRYRLLAMIKHQGSHTQGHYECYKRKPLFVKDPAGNILKISPEIDETSLLEASALVGKEIRDGRDTHDGSRNSASYEDRPGALRNKFSSMMGRRPSISHTDPDLADPQEILRSGMATPAEVMVNHGDYFLGPSISELNELLKGVEIAKASAKVKSNLESKVKMKKIPSLIKTPFWKVGDSQVMEVSKSSVLLETASVYMLYYERVNRP